ncbi:MAG TPA: DegT/DnrJ/EryC1/StrS family aminotransferase [Longimicrobiales bacterium]|nr:DegT/DnrJ/EryC1/StrS family aminotransferase [Longimicrobiales bacterium]
MRRIGFQPPPRLRSIRPGGAPAGAYLGRAFWPCCLGRDALYWAFRMLYPRAGATAWLPSFHCGLEVEAARSAGFDLAFYHVRADLTVDVEDLAARVQARPGPILLIHYFGRGDPATRQIAALCASVGMPLIEDCCHALYSRLEDRWLGSFGQLAAFSLPKTLGTPDGGVLSADLTTLRATLRREPIAPALRTRALWPFVALLDRKSPLPNWFAGSTWAAGPGRPSIPPAADAPPRDYTRRMSLITEWLSAAVRPDLIAQRRRANCEQLAARLRAVTSVQSLWPMPDAGTVPLGLPLFVRDRDRLVRALEAERIESYVFGRYPHPALPDGAFPAARMLREQLIAVPVHHALTSSQLDRLSDVLSMLLPRHALD